MPKEEVSQMRTLAKRRGFPTVSEYIRYLLSESSGDIISNDELLRRSANADMLHRKSKLKKLSSLSDLANA